VLTTYPDGSIASRGYDGAGNLTGQTDQAGHATADVYDPAGQLVSVTDPLNHASAYSYDPAGNLASVTDANGHRTGFAYDALGRQTGKTWPDGSTEAWAYDPATGDQVAHTLADGQTNAYSYDRLSRLTGVAYFDGTSVAFTYTPTGRRATATDARGITTYAYDGQDRLTGITTPSGRQVAYSYDAAGDRTGITTPAGTTGYSYDGLNRLSSVADPSHGSYTYSYDAAGNRTGLAYPNGIAASYGYDALNRLTGITYQRGSGTVASYAYTLAPDGTRTDLAEADGSTTHWAYDAADRLTGETMRGPSGAVTYQAGYGYDPVGNRMGLTVNGQVTAYSYNSLDQLTGSAAGAGPTTYSYNGRGDLTGVAAPGGNTTYAWDAADRLVGTALPNGSTISYGYDAGGRRVSQAVTPQGGAATATNYLWDEASTYGDVVAETNGSGTLTASYVLGASSCGCGGEQGPAADILAQAHGGALSYVLADGQGSTRALADGAGTLTDTYRYDAYGTLLARTGSTADSFLYTGQQYDAATGLYDLRARYYRPTTGRFLSRDTLAPDPQQPEQADRYAYVGGHPITMQDPSGHEEIVDYSAALEEDEASTVSTAARGREVRHRLGLALQNLVEAEALWYTVFDNYFLGTNYRDRRVVAVGSAVPLEGAVESFTLTVGAVNKFQNVVYSRSLRHYLDVSPFFATAKILLLSESNSPGILLPENQTDRTDNHAELLLLRWSGEHHYTLLSVGTAPRAPCPVCSFALFFAGVVFIPYEAS